jgi:hypothetical protein
MPRLESSVGPIPNEERYCWVIQRFNLTLFYLVTSSFLGIPLHHFLYSRIKVAKPVKLPVLPLSSKLPSFFGTVALPTVLVPVKEETIILWGLALTMTSELVSYTQTTKEIARHGQVAPLVRMIKAYPKLSQWDMNGFVRLFCFASSRWRVLKGENKDYQTNM